MIMPLWLAFLAVDHRVDLHKTVLALVPALNADGYTVRNLAVEQAQHLLADNFSDKLTLRLIGYHVLREQLAGLQWRTCRFR